VLKSKKFVITAIYLNVTAIIAARISVGNDIELMQTASAGEGKEHTISGTFEDDTLVGTDSNDRICGFHGVGGMEDLGDHEVLYGGADYDEMD
jgi:hypothetical protein